MQTAEDRLNHLLGAWNKAEVKVQTLGFFQVSRGPELISQKEWGRDIAVQLFQFLVTMRNRRGLHKEQIIDRIWGDSDQKSGEQNFKVALHGINKALEPGRKSRTEARYIIRQGLTYQISQTDFWIDTEIIENLIALGNETCGTNPAIATKAYRAAHQNYQGIYLPNRIYEDWTSEERERIQVLILGAITSLSELLIEENPMESIRLSHKALEIDPTWEDAYRIQMEAYLKRGNRPMAIKTYRQCEKVLDEEYGIVPLPETRAVFQKINAV